jgi:hypothetical protein
LLLVDPYTQLTSDDVDLIYVTGAEIVATLPAEGPDEHSTERVAVRAGGTSPNVADYQGLARSHRVPPDCAPTLHVTSIGADGLRYLAGPTAEGTQLTITGTGLTDATSMAFTDACGAGTATGHVDIRLAGDAELAGEQARWEPVNAAAFTCSGADPAWAHTIAGAAGDRKLAPTPERASVRSEVVW